MKLYSIRDNKTESFSPPFLARQDGEAMRIVLDSSTGTHLERHPGDFALFALATFSDATGVVVGLPAPTLIMSVLEILAIRAGGSKSPADEPAML